MQRIGDRLREERKRLGMTQEQFAAAAGVVGRTQGMYEREDRAPDSIYLAAVARLGVDIGYVVTGDAQGARLSADEALLVQTYRGLDQAGKTAALGAVVGIGQAATGGITQTFHGDVHQVAGHDVVNHEKKR